jgi:hypothetical protein
MSLLGYINLASNAGDTFTNAADSDMLIYTQSNSQKVLIGCSSNQVANLTISSNLTQFNGNIAINNALAIKGLQITVNDGSTMNVTQTAVTGFSNDNLGQSFYIASNTASNYFRFVASNTEVMKITGDGKMGLGTSNPVAMLDVRSNVQVLGGALSVGNGSFEFPPQALTGFTTTLSNAAYGNGTYITSSSTSNFGAVAAFSNYYAFDKTSNNDSLTWVTQGVYNTSTGAYAGVFNTSNDVSTYAGEWLQVLMPTPMMLSSVTIVPPVSTIYRSPNAFAFFGSLDGNAWTQLGSRFTGVTFVSNTAQSFTINANQYFPYIRFVVNQTQTGGDGYGMISELRLFGAYQGISVNVSASNTINLTVPGNMYCGGNISAGNLGMFRNRIINGDMRIDQRNAGAIVANAALAAYIVDRAQLIKVTTATFNIGQSNINYAVPGFKYAFKTTVATSSATIAASDITTVYSQPIEANNLTDLMFGMASAQPITVSFWFYSSIAHTFYMMLRNASTRSYLSPIVAAANTWQYYTYTVPGDTTGTWTTDGTSTGLMLFINTAVGSSRIGPSGNVWLAGDYWGLVSSNGFINTASAFTMITGVQIEKGTMATPFEFRPYAIELQLCQRYYQIIKPSTNPAAQGVGSGNMHGTNYRIYIKLNTPMRIQPTVTADCAGIRMSCAGTDYLTTAINGNYIYLDGGMLDFNTSGATPTAGYGVTVWINSGYGIYFNAELNL